MLQIIRAPLASLTGCRIPHNTHSGTRRSLAITSPRAPPPRRLMVRTSRHSPLSRQSHGLAKPHCGCYVTAMPAIRRSWMSAAVCCSRPCTPVAYSAPPSAPPDIHFHNECESGKCSTRRRRLCGPLGLIRRSGQTRTRASLLWSSAHNTYLPIAPVYSRLSIANPSLWTRGPMMNRDLIVSLIVSTSGGGICISIEERVGLAYT